MPYFPPTGAPAAHAASHQNGGSDEVATTTVAAGAIPKAGAARLAIGWVASGTPDGTKFVRDDGVLALPTAGLPDLAYSTVSLTADYSLPTLKSAIVARQFIIASGIKLTVSTGSRFRIF